MASVDFMKLHSSSEFKRVVRHCDKEMRFQDGHRNKDIHKEFTHKNTQLEKRGYKKVCRMYEEKLAALDKMQGANKRQDRVTAFALEIPAPLNIRDKDKPIWFAKVYEIICMQYDYRNILQYYVHYDEVHEYVHAETGKAKISREHAHCIVIPEHDGKLNGKWFSSRSNMIKLNNSIHEMTIMDFGLEFMDGSKKGSTKRVEQLKRESDIKKYEQEKEKQELILGELRSKIDDLKLGIDNFDEIFALGMERYKELHPV